MCDACMEGLYDDLAEADARIEVLTAALSDAIEEIEHWGSYAGDYFRDKWDLDGQLKRLREVLNATGPDCDTDDH